MKLAKPLLLSAACVSAMLALSLWAYGRMPDAPVATHWDLNGRPDGYAGKLGALLMTPALATGISLFMALLPAIMPRRGSLERSSLPYAVTWSGALIVLLVTHVVIVAKALGLAFDVTKPITFAIALLMLIIGNYMGKIRYNYVFGLRTPWTLADERVWDKTHRLAGWLMVACALVLLAVSLLAPESAEGDGMRVGGLAVGALLPVVAATIYSILLSRRLERASPQS